MHPSLTPNTLFVVVPTGLPPLIPNASSTVLSKDLLPDYYLLHEVLRVGCEFRPITLFQKATSTTLSSALVLDCGHNLNLHELIQAS